MDNHRKPNQPALAHTRIKVRMKSTGTGFLGTSFNEKPDFKDFRPTAPAATPLLNLNGYSTPILTTNCKN